MDQIKPYIRSCPQCNEIIYYKRKKDRNYAEKKKIICKSCSNNNRAQEGNYNPKEEFICFTCGKSFKEWRSQLSNPKTPFCSKQCWYNDETKSLVNQKFGRLLVISRNRTNKTTYYECKCDCGNSTTVTHTNLMNGTESCGCLVKEIRSSERKPLNEVIERAIWNYYKRNAKTRNYEWQINFEQFTTLINGNCNYCGIEKCTPFIHRYKNETASLPYNGIDRLNNHIGYTKENCVSCCKTCNIAKSEMTFEDFKNWINRLSNHLNEGC